MKNLRHDADLCVIGGGMAGILCAIAAARKGVRVVLMHDRPVFGGNASGEIRVPIGGAYGKNNRETGILEEICLENFYRNPTSNYHIWDSILFEKVYTEPNITPLMNCSCLKAETNEKSIVSVTGWQLTTETYHTVYAKYYTDCSGDGILAPLTCAEYRMGREAKSEYNETIPPDVADTCTMGMSCTFQIRETDSPKPFIAPKWAYTYSSDEDLPDCRHFCNGRYSLAEHLWWIELGGDADCIHDTEDLKFELLKIAFGVWDHFKNQGNHGYENWEMDWIEFLPGKRESRRYVGDHVLTQHDVEAGGRFPDVVAYAGWSMDDHFPQGFYYREGHPTTHHPAPSPWGIPLRSLHSKDFENLFFAGRNISATHAAISSCRVIATCAMMGQAVGTAVAQMINEGISYREIDIEKLQQTLLYDDCYLPYVERNNRSLFAVADVNHEIVRNGRERGDENLWIGKEGDCVEYRFHAPQFVKELRLVFDSDLNRHFVEWLNRSFQQMPHIYPLGENRFRLPETLIREYQLEICDDKGIVSLETHENHLRFSTVAINKMVSSIKFIPRSTWGCEDFRLFCVEPILA